MMRPIGFEKACRDVHLELGGKPPHRDHGRVPGGRQRSGEMALVLHSTEIMALEQFGRQDHLRALAGGLADQTGHGSDIRLDVVGEGQLERGDGKLGHGFIIGTAGPCCKMQ